MDRDEVIALANKFDMRKGRRPRTTSIPTSKPALATRSDVEAAAKLYDERLARASAYARKRRRDGKSTGPPAVRARTPSIVRTMQNIHNVSCVSPNVVVSSASSQKIEYQSNMYQYRQQRQQQQHPQNQRNQLHLRQPLISQHPLHPQHPHHPQQRDGVTTENPARLQYDSNSQQTTGAVAQNRSQNAQHARGPRLVNNQREQQINHSYQNRLQNGESNQVLVYGPHAQPTTDNTGNISVGSNEDGRAIYGPQVQTNPESSLFTTQPTTNSNGAVYQTPSHTDNAASMFGAQSQNTGRGSVYQAQVQNSSTVTAYHAQNDSVYQAPTQQGTHNATVFQAKPETGTQSSVYETNAQANGIESVYNTQTQATSDGSTVFQAQVHQTGASNTDFEPQSGNEPDTAVIYQPHRQSAVDNAVYDNTQESSNATVAYEPNSAQTHRTTEISEFGQHVNTEQVVDENFNRVEQQSCTNGGEVEAFGHEGRQAPETSNVETYVVGEMQNVVVYSDQPGSSHGDIPLVATGRRRTADTSFGHELETGQANNFGESFVVGQKQAVMMNEPFEARNDDAIPSGVGIDGGANAIVLRGHVNSEGIETHETTGVGHWESTDTPGLNVESVIVMNSEVAPRESVEAVQQSAQSSTSVMYPVDQSTIDDSLVIGSQVIHEKRAFLNSKVCQKEKAVEERKYSAEMHRQA